MAIAVACCIFRLFLFILLGRSRYLETHRCRDRRISMCCAFDVGLGQSSSRSLRDRLQLSVLPDAFLVNVRRIVATGRYSPGPSRR